MFEFEKETNKRIMDESLEEFPEMREVLEKTEEGRRLLDEGGTPLEIYEVCSKIISNDIDEAFEELDNDLKEHFDSLERYNDSFNYCWGILGVSLGILGLILSSVILVLIFNFPGGIGVGLFFMVLTGLPIPLGIKEIRKYKRKYRDRRHEINGGDK